VQDDVRVYGMKEDRLGDALADEFRSARATLRSWNKGNGDFAAVAKDVCALPPCHGYCGLSDKGGPLRCKMWHFVALSSLLDLPAASTLTGDLEMCWIPSDSIRFLRDEVSDMKSWKRSFRRFGTL
jgi:hypothetical protein